ncbi:GNAT family N-acetyltransferase [Paenisporosarcina antarctica]|uniref:GNAT family N-acetyltransferase n=1 Tax=Paenisporosarcina antarctica TaxID=417367 RepID=A0A4P7A176_9BACL|nr:GNAT family N-acetyltransferase [Paenisporosarcina antarctica]QBP42770.1 GNAT family N-acetyltransferase [Paenisporosarcina antarctica]
MTTHFIKLTEPTSNLVEVFNRWENDSTLIPLTRPNRNQSELELRYKLTLNELTKRLENHHIYLIYLDDQLIGEMNYMVDPIHLYKKEQGTAWIGITIGESEGRGKGIGYAAIQYLEDQIKKQGLKRVELGVFEFNKQAQKLYEKLGYKKIGSIDSFTFWQDKMWTDIRMEKYI